MAPRLTRRAIEWAQDPLMLRSSHHLLDQRLILLSRLLLFTTLSLKDLLSLSWLAHPLSNLSRCRSLSKRSKTKLTIRRLVSSNHQWNRELVSKLRQFRITRIRGAILALSQEQVSMLIRQEETKISTRAQETLYVTHLQIICTKRVSTIN